MRLPEPIICVVTRARGVSGSPERERLLERLSAAAGAGASMIQIRERQLDDRQLIEFVTDVRQAIEPHSAKVLVNDRLDIVLAAGGDGVHLKADGASAADVRRIARRPIIVGQSVHSAAEARAAEAAGSEYLLFGTVFPSRSKPDDHRIAGVGELQAVCRAVRIPVIAIGGITVERTGAARAAGAAGVAAISLFAETPDIESTVDQIRSALTVRQGHV